jgi:microcystin-dependent protein
VQSSFGDVPRVIAQVQQRIQRTIGYEYYVSTTTAIASRWPTFGHELFTSESSNTITAVSSLDVNLGTINKHLNQNDARAHNSVLAQASCISVSSIFYAAVCSIG